MLTWGYIGHVERLDEENSPIKALHLQVNRSKKRRSKNRWKEVLECDVIARGLQRLDGQDRQRL